MNRVATPSDAELLHRIQVGDYAAFTTLYDRYIKNLTAYGLKFTTDLQVVEDSLHDIFVYLWNKRKEITVQISIKSYLIKAVRNEVLQKLQRLQKQVPLGEEGEVYPFALSLSAEQQYIDRERSKLLSEQITQLLSQLTAKQKEVIYLRYYEGLSFDEIAQNMDLSLKACYKLMGRAIADLRKSMPLPWFFLLFFVQ